MLDDLADDAVVEAVQPLEAARRLDEALGIQYASAVTMRASASLATILPLASATIGWYAGRTRPWAKAVSSWFTV